MRNKTGKRELAFVFSVILIYQIFQNNVEMVEVIIWPIVSLIAAAAGLHIYDKVSNTGYPTDRMQSDRSGHYSSKELDWK